MELILYLFGNMLCNCATIIPFMMWNQHRAKTEVWDVDNKAPSVVVLDMQIMIFLGTITRMYWSTSPPAVWTDEIMPIQWLSILDVFLSPFLWGALCFLVGRNQQKKSIERNMPKQFRWPFLTACSLCLGFIGCYILPALDMSQSYPFADVAVITNMTIDGMAMIPQMYITLYDENKTTQESSHFVGLLCLGRLFRMFFWASIIITQFLSETLSGSHFMWTFVVPDLIHTFLMGDYLYIWLRKLKQDKIEPLLERYSSYV